MNPTQHAVLEAIAQHPGAMSPVLLSHLLAGVVLGRMAEKGLLESSHFGALSGVPVERLDAEIFELRKSGLVVTAREHYAALSLTPNGRAALSASHLAAVEEKPITTVSPDAAFERYHAWRKAIAKRQGKPPYRILTNPMLNALARLEPSTLEELLAVPGLGKLRALRYQADLLAIGAQLRDATPAAAAQ